MSHITFSSLTTAKPNLAHKRVLLDKNVAFIKQAQLKN